jgi:hypothetical protein
VSVVLYLAIIVIWLFILVPRWLRKPHEMQAVRAARDQSADPGEFADPDYAADDEAGAERGDPPEHEQTGPAGGRPAGAPPAVRRSRVLQARRRLLTILVLLAAVAGACVALKLTSWWACVPPAVMLGMYLLLLREASLADAEQARRRTAADLRVQAVRQRAHEDQIRLQEQEQDQYSAQIIDISARVGDQLYDQYADATVRAVGD